MSKTNRSLERSHKDFTRRVRQAISDLDTQINDTHRLNIALGDACMQIVEETSSVEIALDDYNTKYICGLDERKVGLEKADIDGFDDMRNQLLRLIDAARSRPMLYSEYFRHCIICRNRALAKIFDEPASRNSKEAMMHLIDILFGELNPALAVFKAYSDILRDIVNGERSESARAAAYEELLDNRTRNLIAWGLAAEGFNQSWLNLENPSFNPEHDIISAFKLRIDNNVANDTDDQG